MRRILLFLPFIFCSSAIFAQEFTYKNDFFTPGNSLTWSYAEWNEAIQDWDPPYLYETYSITEVKGTEVTIEMDSSDGPNAQGEPHHKFIADFQRCKELGVSRNRLRRFKIAFYSKSIGDDWTLLSRRFEGLAFTEKFNCLSEESNFVTRDVSQNFLSINEVFQWQNFDIKSWYAIDDSLIRGVALERRVKTFLMKLVKVNEQSIERSAKKSNVSPSNSSALMF